MNRRKERVVGDLIDTTEMYLKTIYELLEDRIVPMRARIVERLGHSGPTVSQTIRRMERDGLVIVGEDRRLRLTEKGRDIATAVMRKHRLAELLLIDIVGIDWELAHDEACRWEHVMTDAVTDRLAHVLGDPTLDPYGNPIPGQAEADPTAVSLSDQRAEAADGDQLDGLIISRIGEPIQADQLAMQAFSALELRRGDEISVTFWRSSSEIRSMSGKARESQIATIPSWMELHLFVTKK